MPAGPRPLSPAGEKYEAHATADVPWVPELSRTATWLSLPKPSRPIGWPRCDRPYYRQVAVLAGDHSCPVLPAGQCGDRLCTSSVFADLIGQDASNGGCR